MANRLAELVVWSLATTVVMTLAWIALGVVFLMFAYIGVMSSSIVQVTLFISGGFLAGVIVGAGQWFVLRPKVAWAKSWFKSTVISWTGAAVAWWIQYQFLGGSGFEIGWEDVTTAVLILGVVSGLVLGGVQWLIMRRSASISPLWILSTVASWFVAALVSAFVLTHFDFGLLSYLVPLLILGLIVGLGTGLAQLILIADTSQPPASTN